MNIVIVGGGFSAYILDFYLQKNLKVKPLVISSDGFDLPNNLIRRKKLEKNKLYVSRAKSFGTAEFIGNDYIFHDRLICGGNSSVWGGFINVSNLNYGLINSLIDAGIYIRPISKNINVIYKDECKQLQDLNGNIFCVEKKLLNPATGYATKILNNSSLEVYKDGRYEIIKFDYLFLCLGFVQLIDLMIRSFPDLISSISASEPIYSEALKFKIDHKLNINDCHIYYNLSAVIKHLGLFKESRVSIKTPYFAQSFSQQVNTINFAVHGNRFYRFNDGSNYFFGKSIHYHNLKLDNKPIKQFIDERYSNIIGCGAAFLDYLPPGPISQELINGAKNIIHEKFNIDIAR